jgi:hypothetical protein
MVENSQCISELSMIDANLDTMVSSFRMVLQAAASLHITSGL